MTKQSWRIAPNTPLGVWSVFLVLAMLILIIIGTSFTNTLYQSTPAGDAILKDIAARPALALTMLAGMAAGIATFFIGLFAIIKQKDNTLLVYTATVIGAIFLLLLIGEMLFPH